MNIDYQQDKYINPEIMEGKITDTELYHDLVGYLDEMFKAIPDKKEKEIFLKNISIYYDSLNILLIKHTLEQNNN